MTIGQTLWDAAGAADVERSFAREPELALTRDLLDRSTASRVHYLHGPGGIGKSALLRAIGRVSTQSRYRVERLQPSLDSLAHVEASIASIPQLYPLVLVVDDIDLLGSERPAWRERLFDALPATMRVVVAGREAPDPPWRRDGLDAIVVDRLLRPLDDETAMRVLVGYGVETERIGALVDWARGSPLALTVAALSSGEPTGRPVSEELESRLTTWITGHALLDIYSEVLEVAAWAPVVDVRLLAAVVPARPTQGAMARLIALPVVEAQGDRAMLHPVLSAAIQARLTVTALDRKRDLIRRIVDHLGSRARLGGHLVIGRALEVRHRFEDAAGDLQSPVGVTVHRSDRAWRVRSDGAGPGVRSRAGLGGADRVGLEWSVVSFGGSADQWVGGHVRGLRPGRRHRRPPPGDDQSSTGDGRLWGGSIPIVRRCGVLFRGSRRTPCRRVAPRDRCIHAPPRVAGLPAMADRLHDPHPRTVALNDFRPGGAAGFVEALVRADLGLRLRETDRSWLLTDDDDPNRLDTLRVRLSEVFGALLSDPRLKRVIELAHGSPRAPESACLDELHVSRRTCFRLLRTERERVVASEP